MFSNMNECINNTYQVNEIQMNKTFKKHIQDALDGKLCCCGIYKIPRLNIYQRLLLELCLGNRNRHLTNKIRGILQLKDGMNILCTTTVESPIQIVSIKY